MKTLQLNRYYELEGKVLDADSKKSTLHKSQCRLVQNRTELKESELPNLNFIDIIESSKRNSYSN